MLISNQVQSTKDQVANIIREAILTNQFKSGERLNLNTIAEQIGVSLTPVREALQDLTREGLVVSEPRKGAVVAIIDEKYVSDYYGFRIPLECAAVRYAVEKEADLSTVKKSFNKMKISMEMGEYETYGSYNLDFHEAIWTAAQNNRITDTLRSLWIGRSFNDKHDTKENAEVSFTEHKAIVSYMLLGDANKAEEAMRLHLIRSRNDVMSNFRNDPPEN